MSVNCSAHVVNLSAKSWLWKLETNFYDGCEIWDAERESLDEIDNFPVDKDGKLLEKSIEHGKKVEDTVLKASKSSVILAQK
jgi:hypothetical protein